MIYHISVVYLLIFGDVTRMKTDCRKAKIIFFGEGNALLHFFIIGTAVYYLFNTHMGTHLAKMLSGNGHDITVVDVEPKALVEVGNLVDVVTVEGDTTQFSVLRKAGVRKCDLFIAVRSVQNDNILSAVMAKQLGAKKAIARVDSSEYLEPNSKEVFIDMGIDYIFYPEQIAAREVINLLGHTSTTEYVDFAGGKLSMVAFRLELTSPLLGRKVIDTSSSDDDLEYRTVAIVRGSRTIIPTADDRYEEEDMIYVLTRHSATQKVVELSGRREYEIRNTSVPDSELYAE